MSNRVRIPADLNTPDPFLSVGPIKMSMSQLGIVFLSMFGWYGVARYGVQELLGLNTMFSMIATAWIPILGLAFAFVKIRRRTLDVYLAEMLTFVFGAKVFTNRDQNSKGGEADLYSDKEMDAMLEQFQQRRRDM